MRIGHHATPMNVFPSSGIYAITDGRPDGLIDRVSQAIAGGVAVVQYRDLTDDHARRRSEAGALASLCREHHIPLIIDHDVELAKATRADGVHLSQADRSPQRVRDELGADAIIGVSCYASRDLAAAAAQAGASYVSFGAFFPSPTKPAAGRASFELLHATAGLGIPRVAIGGITLDNGRSLVDAGADLLASVSAVFGTDTPRASAARLAALFTV